MTFERRNNYHKKKLDILFPVNNSWLPKLGWFDHNIDIGNSPEI